MNVRYLSCGAALVVANAGTRARVIALVVVGHASTVAAGSARRHSSR
jgi:hypothetical protein